MTNTGKGGLSIRQGTVYRDRKNGGRLLLIHHNPMELQSLLFRSAPGEGAFDLARPEVIGVDDLIELRRSGEYEELGDLPRPALDRALDVLLSSGGLPEKIAMLLRSIRGEDA